MYNVHAVYLVTLTPLFLNGSRHRPGDFVAPSVGGLTPRGPGKGETDMDMDRGAERGVVGVATGDEVSPLRGKSGSLSGLRAVPPVVG